MADYEALAPGGHAHLVSDIKSYADRAGGKGTTQLADGAVTRAKLASDVIARLEHMHDMGDTLKGNNFFGTLAEGTVLTADDVYGAPSSGVEVYGVSTQVQTTGKNLWNDARYSDVGWTHYGAGWYNGKIKSFTTGITDLGSGSYPEGARVTVSADIVRAGNSGAIQFHFAYTDGTDSHTSNITTAYGLSYTSTSGKTVSRAYVSTSAGEANEYFYLKNLQVEIGATATAYEPYSAGTVSPNPTYPRAIDSVDTLTFNMYGKNLLDGSTDAWEVGSANGVGVPVSNTIRLRTVDYIPLAEGTYTFSVASGYKASAIYFYDKDHAFIASVITQSANAFDAPAGTAYAKAFIGKSDDSDISVSDVTAAKPQLELGSTATAYEPYVGHTVTIPLQGNKARSLPDGTRDQLTLSYVKKSTTPGYGVFRKVLTQRIDECDMGDLEWEYSTTYHMMHAEVDGMRTAESGTYTLYCTGYRDYNNASVSSLDTNMPDKSIAQRANYAILYVKDTGYTDAELFTTAVTGMKVQYALAAPVTHDLGTVELPVLPAPDLTAWCDGGSAQPSMSIGYEQDVNIVIAGLEAAIAELATA